MRVKSLIYLAVAAVAGGVLWRRRRMCSFADKVVVITGGSRGLGLAMAREFGRKGAKLALISRKPEELELAALNLVQRGVQEVTTWPCDVRDTEEARRTLEAIVRRYGRLDVLVNNAGTILVAPLETMTREDFEDALDIHFWAPYHLMMSALPHLRQVENGRIVNISSVGGRVAVPHLAPYCASKFALAGLSDAFRSELAKEDICVTTVTPGLMRTGSHVNAWFKGNRAKEFTWFSLGASMPFLSMNASRAARQIVVAVGRGRPELTITFQARLAIAAQAIFPNLTARILKLANALLPKVGEHPDLSRHKGRDSQSTLSPSPLTALADAATPEFNEGPRLSP